MKKFVALLIPFLFLGVSCEKENNHKILSYFHEDLTSLIYVNQNEVKTLASNQEDFILFVFSDCGCGGHGDSVFSTLKTYISETHRLIYAIGDTDYKKLDVTLSDTFPLYPTNQMDEINKIPAFYFYHGGKLTYERYYEESLLTVKGITSLMNDYMTPYGMNIINDIVPYTFKGYDFFKFNEETTTKLDQKIQGNNTIYYSWKQCGDCRSLKGILRDYYLDHNTLLYMYEVDYFRNSDNKETLWDNEEGFPYQYQFANYRGGKVPSLVTYENGLKKDMIVYHNDVVNDGTIETSFFNELVGQKLSAEEQENYHKEKVLEYLSSLKE